MKAGECKEGRKLITIDKKGNLKQNLLSQERQNRWSEREEWKKEFIKGWNGKVWKKNILSLQSKKGTYAHIENISLLF